MKRTSTYLLLLTTLCILTLGRHVFAAGELDPSFNGAVTGTTLGTGYAVKGQPDGKILIGGIFTSANLVAAPGLIRVNADGSTDTSFNVSNAFVALGTSGFVTAIALQPDGKILVGGGFNSFLGSEPGVRRLNSDGSLDTTFTPFIVSPGSWIYDIELRPDGKVLVGGTFSGPGMPTNLARLNSDGTVDSTLASQPDLGIRDLDVQPNGRIVLGGHPVAAVNQGVVRRILSTGETDATFIESTYDGRVEAVKMRADGAVLVGGHFSGRLRLLNSDGTQGSFNPGGTGFSNVVGNFVMDIEFTADGKIMVGGYFSRYNSADRANLLRLAFDGVLDSTFNGSAGIGGTQTVYDLDVLAGNNVVTALHGGAFPRVAKRFNSVGSLDSQFSPLLTKDGVVYEVQKLPDGKILIGGNFQFVEGVKRNGCARLNPDGTLDTTFVPFFNNNAARAVVMFALQPDGKFFVGFEGGVFAPIRMNPDGTHDTTFNESSAITEVRDVAFLPSGQLLMAGPGFGIRRYNSTGTTDNTFSAPVVGIQRMVSLPDGKILIAGTFSQVGSTPRGRIARLNPNGSLDTSFNPPGGADGWILDFEIQPDGKIVVVGDFATLNGVPRLRIGRLMPDGALDTTFSSSADGMVRTVELQPDGKMFVGGSFGFVESQSRVGLARLNANGSLDASFIARPNTSVFDVELQADNKVLIGGEFLLVNGQSALRVARLLNNAVPTSSLFDYDGDDKADVSVFRPSENKWYIFRSSDSVITQQIFAIAGDVPAPADYDGDQKTDMAIYRPSQGGWWYLSTVDGQPKFAQLGGEAGDVPRPSDFDGDGRADFVIFRPSNSTWYRISSGNGATSTIQFGLAGDKPVTGDFDGDGKSDVAIYRPSSGDWWYQSSINNAQLATHFGISTDIPTPADFDGDGRTDFAVYRPSTGVWYILNSSNGSATIMAFGISEDKPVAADYDGDGKADIAVFRPSTGVWYLMRSTAGFTAMQFGISTDIPTENSFIP